VNELGVVYLFGVLNDIFDFKIESIQAGFPDCVARRRLSANRWEEWRIEFEYSSKSFVQHKHDPEQVDMIVCWKHDWKNCPEYIEVIELSSELQALIDIQLEVDDPKTLTDWQEFCREKRLEGLSFSEIAELWGKKTRKQKEPDRKPELSEWQKFCAEKRLEGKTFSEIGRLWRQMKKTAQQQTPPLPKVV
jgi:hypothetical protein